MCGEMGPGLPGPDMNMNKQKIIEEIIHKTFGIPGKETPVNVLEKELTALLEKIESCVPESSPMRDFSSNSTIKEMKESLEKI